MTTIAQFRLMAVVSGVALSGLLSVTPAFAATYPTTSQSSDYYSNLVCDRYSPSCLSQQWSYVNSQNSSNNYSNNYNVGSNGSYGYAPSTNGYSYTPSYGYSSYPTNSYTNSYYPSYWNSNYSNSNYGYIAPTSTYRPVTTIYASTPVNYNYQYQYNTTPSYSSYPYSAPNYSYNSYPTTYGYSTYRPQVLPTYGTYGN